MELAAASGAREARVPLASVVVPTFDREHLIGATLDSVLAQTLKNWECIVVDDGSTDQTESVVGSYCARDSRFRYIWQENAGASAARNRGIELARGRYIAFLDSDDHFAEDKLEWQVAALEADPDAVLAYGNALHCRSRDMRAGEIYQGNRVPKPSGWAFEQLICNSSIYAPLVRTESIRGAGGFDESFALAEDWDMWLTLAKKGKLVFDPRISLYYRVHQGNRSGSFREYAHARRVVAKHTREMPAAKRRALRRRARRYLRAYLPRLLEEADALNAAGEWEEARHVWLAIARLEPRTLRSPRTLACAAWALLPASVRPPWWRGRRGAEGTATPDNHSAE